MQTNKPEEKAIPMISVDPNTGKYVFEQEAINFIKSINGPIGVISVAGMYRTGKSYLLNRMLLNRSNGFGVGPTVNPCTKGLWCWNTPIKGATTQGQTINIIVIDTEGIGALDEDQTHDTRIFTLAILASSCFIYNSVGSIDQNAVQNLSLVVNLTKHIHLKSQSKNQQQENDPDEFANFFPSFFWVVRDFTLQLVDQNEEPITSKQYLERALAQQKGISDDVEEKNRIRRLLTTFFKERECFTLIRPLVKQENLQNLDKLDFQHLRPEFVQQVMNFRKRILTRMRPKVLNEKRLNGEMYTCLVKNYVAAINNGAVPNIQNAWNYMCKQQCVKIKDQACSIFQMKFKQLMGSDRNFKTEDQFRNISRAAKEQAYQYFKNKSFGDNIEQFQKALKMTIKTKLKAYKSHYEKQCVNYLSAFFSKNIQGVQKKLKQNQYKSFIEFQKETMTAYQQNMENCPNLFNKKLVFLQIVRRMIGQGAAWFLNLYQHEIMLQKNNVVQKQKNFDRENKSLKQQLKNQRKINSQKIQVLDKEKVEATIRIERLIEQLDQVKNFNQQQSGKLGKNLQYKNAEIQNLKENLRKKMSELNSKNDQLMLILNKKNELETERAVFEAKIKQFTDQIQLMNLNLKAQENNINVSKNEYSHQLKQNTANYQKKLNQIKNLFGKQKQKNSQLNQQIKLMKQQYKNFQQKTREKEKKYQQDLSNKIAEIQKIRIDKQFEKNNLMAQLANNKEQKGKNEQELTITNNQLRQNIKNITQQFKAQKSSADTEIAVLKQQYGFLQSQLQETKAQLIQTKNNHEQILANMQSDYQRNSEQLLRKQIDEERNRFTTQIKKNNQLIQTQKKEFQQALQLQTKAKTQLELKLSLVTNTFNKQKQQYENIQRKLTQQINRLQTQRKLAQNKSEEDIKQNKNYYEIKIMKLEEQMEELKYKSQCQSRQSHSKSEEAITQLKNYYELQKQKAQSRIITEKEKAEKKLKEKIEELKKAFNQQRQILENQLEQTQLQFSNLNQTYEITKDRLSGQIIMKDKKIENLQWTLAQNLKHFNEKEVDFNTKYTQIMKKYKEDRTIFQNRLNQLQNQFNKKDTEYIKLSAERQHLAQILDKTIRTNQQVIKDFSVEKINLQSNLDQIKLKFTNLSNEYMEKKSQNQKEIALLSQQIDFRNSKICQIQKQKQNLQNSSQQRLKKLKEEILEQSNRRYIELEKQMNTLQQKYQKLKSTSKQQKESLSKNLLQTERQSLIKSQKLVSIQKQLKANQQKRQIVVESLKKQIVTIQQNYKTERDLIKSQIDQLKSNLQNITTERDSLKALLTKNQALWQNSLNHQKNRAKQFESQANTKIKKLQLNLQSTIAKYINQKTNYQKQFNEKFRQKQNKLIAQNYRLNQNNTKISTESDKKLKQCENEIKSLKQRLSYEIQHYTSVNSKLQKTNNELKQNNSKITTQVEKLRKQKQMRNGELQILIEKQKEIYKSKLKQAQEKIKNAQNQKRKTFFDLQKQRARWSTQNTNHRQNIQGLKQTIEKHKSQLQKLSRQNERLKQQKKYTKNNISGNTSVINGKWMNKSNLGQYTILDKQPEKQNLGGQRFLQQ